MRIVTRTDEMIRASRDLSRAGQAVGFVPTMGFLHEGHTSLMDLLRPRCHTLVVSIFVNPLQFGPNEDLDRYPRDPEGDAARCQAHGTDLLFMPTDFYPPDFRTHVRVDHVTRHLCGASRPGHFEGVATVVARLFGVVGPRLAAFGEKDWQQLTVIRRMVDDLAMDIQIVPGPTVREPDGLALSSRNKYLSPQDRIRALSLSRALRAMQASPLADVEALKRSVLPLLEVDALHYLEVVGDQDLEPLSTLDRPARALVAARVGTTRLIDNMALAPRA